MWVEQELIELRSSRYSAAAWLLYARRALAFARERALGNPAAVRSVLFVGLILFLGAVACAAVLAVVVDPGLARRAFGWTVVGLVPMIVLTLLHIDLLRDKTGTPLDAIGWPSAITLTRVALVPAFLVFMAARQFKLAFLAYMIAIASDIVDGWVARRFHQETRFGTILDPLADILCSFWLFVGLYIGGLAPLLALVLAALRMLLLLVGGSFLYVTRGPVRIHSTLPGKMTGLLLTGLVVVRLAFAAFDLGPLAERLTPLSVDAFVVLLGFTLLYGWVIGWINLKRLRGQAPSEPGVVTDVRFGA
ncbi:MAG: CDP-alcohol phosphatidyltransferase family protein [Candidatus Eiseniibacteriota bacterium]